MAEERLTPRQRELLGAILELGESQFDLLFETYLPEGFYGSHSEILGEVRKLRQDIDQGKTL